MFQRSFQYGFLMAASWIIPCCTGCGQRQQAAQVETTLAGRDCSVCKKPALKEFRFEHNGETHYFDSFSCKMTYREHIGYDR